MAPLTIGFPFFQNVCPSVGGFDPHLGVTKNGVCVYIYTIKTPISIGKIQFNHWILACNFRKPPKNDENIVVDNNNNTW